MPLILVWNQDPSHISVPGGIPVLAHELGKACVSVDALGLKDASDVLVSFQGGAIRAELEQPPAPLLIVVELLYDKPERTIEVKRLLAEALGSAARMCVGSTRAIEVFVRTFNPQHEAAWFSNG